MSEYIRVSDVPALSDDELIQYFQNASPDEQLVLFYTELRVRGVEVPESEWGMDV